MKKQITGITILGKNPAYLEALALVLRETIDLPCDWIELKETSEIVVLPSPGKNIFILDMINFPVDLQQAIFRLKKQSPECEVIGVHNLCNDTVAKKVEAWGADAYILKPHIISDLEKYLHFTGKGMFFSSECIAYSSVSDSLVSE